MVCCCASCGYSTDTPPVLPQVAQDVKVRKHDQTICTEGGCTSTPNAEKHCNANCEIGVLQGQIRKRFRGLKEAIKILERMNK